MDSGRDAAAGALFETLPLVGRERRWSFVDVLAVNTGLAIATWAFLFGGATAQLVGFVDGVLAILLGSAIGVIILLLALLPVATKWGAEWYVSQRSVFGPRGAVLYMAVVELSAIFFWSAILASMSGNAVTDVVSRVMPGAAILDWPLATMVALGLLALVWLLIRRGSGGIRILNLIAAPALVVLCLWLMGSVLTQFSVAEIAAAPALAPASDDHATNVMLAIELNITAGMGWFSLMANLGRYARTPRGAVWGNFLAYVPIAGAAAIVGLMSSLVLGSDDPVTWMVPIVGVFGGMVLLAILVIANFSSLVASLQSNCQSLVQNFGPRVQSLGWPGLTLLVVLGVAALVVLGSDALFDRFSTIVSYIQAAFASAAGVALADYAVLRRRRLDLRAIYDSGPGGAYYFWGGFNPAAFAAIGAGAFVYLWLFDPLSFATAPLFRFASASLPTVAAAFCVHLVLTKAFVMRAGRGGY